MRSPNLLNKCLVPTGIHEKIEITGESATHLRPPLLYATKLLVGQRCCQGRLDNLPHSLVPQIACKVSKGVGD